MVCPSVRSPEFTGKPPYVSRFHRVARNDFVPYGVALGALEPAMFKAHRTRNNARQHHGRRAAQTARALDGCEGWTGGKRTSWHDASLHLGGSLQHSQSPIGADTRAVMEPPCASEFRSRWSILLTFQNSTQNKRPQRGGELRPGQFGVTVYRCPVGTIDKAQPGTVSCVESASGLVRPVPSVSLRWKGAGFYWPTDSAGTV